MQLTRYKLRSDLPSFLPMLTVSTAGTFSLWGLTFALGASFGSGAEALLGSCMLLIAAYGAQLLTRRWARTIGYATPALVWPCWWPVLTSMALRQIDPATGVVPLRFAQAWYSSVWFKVLVEIGLLVLFALAVMRTRRKHRAALRGTPTESMVLPAERPPALLCMDGELSGEIR
ncbi:hypothetical protein [Ralstonia sp. UBA689]|uniref:hypothetical protein n=1 Tax=Ralstonia sp. UBA689 TaxID=1947373 RepID=UPI0025F5CF34|nr:hypothetical protein [Ralstonia sp. UBA689]